MSAIQGYRLEECLKFRGLDDKGSPDMRVAPATRTRGEGGRRLPSPLVIDNKYT